MYHAYWTRFLKADMREYEIVAVEAPFAIDLSLFRDDLPNYIGRIDLALQDKKNNLIIMDHKTTKALYPMTLPGFIMSLQSDGYMTAGHIFYSRIPKMIYSMSICQKSKIAFHRYEIIKNKSALERFLKDIVSHISTIINDIDLYESELPKLTHRSDYMKSFKRCPGYACTAFMTTCPYMDICQIRSNPSLWRDKPPSGYTVNEWDPDLAGAEIEKQLKQLKEVK